MDLNFDFFRTTMPVTRKADYYLGCLDSSVFIDFNCSKDNLISLVRISFDGFGCCSLGEKGRSLDLKDSIEFIKEIEKKSLDQIRIATLVKKIISINQEHIWPEAIERYGLIE